MRYLILSIISFICISVNAADNATDSLRYDIAELFRILSSDKGVSMSMTVSVYPSATSTTPVYSKKATVKKKGSCFMYTVDKYIMVLNKDYILLVDKGQKTIIINKNEGLNDFYNTKGPIDVSMIYGVLDSTFSSYKSVALMAAQPNKRRYNINLNDILLENLEMEINLDTHCIAELQYLYDEKKMKKNNKVIVRFTEFKTDNQLKQEDFSEKAFVKIVGSNIKPSKEYEGFAIIKQ
jgi:hypothetical protein